MLTELYHIWFCVDGYRDHCAGKQYTNSNIGTIFVGHFFNIMGQSMGSRTKTALDQILLLTLSGCLTMVRFLICAAVSS